MSGNGSHSPCSGGVEVCTEDFIWHVGDIGYMDDSYAHSPVRQEHYTFAARMDLEEDEWKSN